jgi:hypothetical protein
MVMPRGNRISFEGWTVPGKQGFVNRELSDKDDRRDAMQHEGDKLKEKLKVKKLVPRYLRS